MKARGICRCPLPAIIPLLVACTPQREQPSPAASTAPTEAVAAAPAPPTTTARPSATVSASPVAASDVGRRQSFDEGAVGAMPDGWTAPIGAWRLEAAADAPSGDQVLLQHAKGPSAQFNVALAPGVSARDIQLGVKLRARDGRIDQGGGVVWRAADGRNYYIARYNPLEDNYRVYVVKDGRRRQLGSAKASVDRQGWHEIVVTMKGDHIRCALDGEPMLDVRDATFAGAGAVGLWTKADAQTAFDDFWVKVLDGDGDGDGGTR